MQLLTDKQQLVLAAIQRHIALTGHSPTVREIGAAVDLRSSCSVQKHLDNLERLGKIQRTSFKYRSIELVDELPAQSSAPWSPAGFLVPLMGYVNGGPPAQKGPPSQTVRSSDPELLLVPDNTICSSERAAQADACALRNYDAAPYFALAVRGDSMQGAGITDGDIIVARRQRAAESGQIVIARIGSGEPTVKRFFNEGRRVRLQPENPAYKPIVSSEAQILGRVTLAIKRF